MVICDSMAEIGKDEAQGIVGLHKAVENSLSWNVSRTAPKIMGINGPIKQPNFVVLFDHRAALYVIQNNRTQTTGIPSVGPTGYEICMENILIVCGRCQNSYSTVFRMKDPILAFASTGILAKKWLEFGILKLDHISTLRTRWILGRQVIIDSYQALEGPRELRSR